MPDKLDELLAQQDEYKAKHKIVETLLASPEWKWLSDTLMTNVSIQRQNEFEGNIESLDHAFRSAHRKGLIAGLRLALTTPYTFKDQVQTDLDLVASQIKEQQDD